MGHCDKCGQETLTWLPVVEERRSQVSSQVHGGHWVCKECSSDDLKNLDKKAELLASEFMKYKRVIDLLKDRRRVTSTRKSTMNDFARDIKTVDKQIDNELYQIESGQSKSG
jgi:hypothetical protein